MMNEAKLRMWIEHVFDDASEGREWRGREDDVPELMAAIFERAGELLTDFSDAQLDQGFWYLMGAFGWPSVLVNEGTPAAMRLRVLRSFVPLFEKVMAVRCTPDLGHLCEDGGIALNSSCYMWWDLLDLNLTAKDWIEFDPEVTMVLRRILAIQHDACRESALHGIGHLIERYGADSEALPQIIDEFLHKTPGMRPELAAYAANARRGCVL
ncbi:MAG TPA: hypothetical protein VHC90_02805 [Bryobacteraceae bacterium]|nr:hypothetical protein [Bryobacteraceae bacterium]